MIDIFLDNESNKNEAWKEIIEGYLVDNVSFELHIWNEEKELIKKMKAYGVIFESDWKFGVVFAGKVTAEFKEMLLSSHSTKTDNKATPFFSIFLSDIFYSEHYGTELHIKPNAKKPYRCRCCNNKTFYVPPKYSLSYICPVCYWEEDSFITSDSDPSDCNHGLSLNDAKANYLSFGACSKDMLEHARPATQEEMA